jgi:hypothetical protein
VDSSPSIQRVLSQLKMTEAEVSLRVAFHLLRTELAGGDIHVAIDGAQVQTGDQVHFPIAEFLAASECVLDGSAASFRGSYRYRSWPHRIIIHSNPGRGDVVALLKTGRTLRVESKKGPLSRSKSSQEYPLLREALGQLLTVEEAGSSDLLAVAVPDSPKFRELAARWRRAPLVAKLGIQILTVRRDGVVEGLGADAA